MFGKAGEAAAQYLAKGWLVAVDGRIEQGEWDTDGRKRHDYTVVGNVEFLTAPVPPRSGLRLPPCDRVPLPARGRKEPGAA